MLRIVADSLQAGWQELGFLTWELFCESRLHKPAVEIEAEATLRKHGANQHGDKGGLDNCQVLPVTEKGGNDPVYWKARIARDKPEELKEIGKGKKYKTFNAAAIGSQWNIRISLTIVKLIQR